MDGVETAAVYGTDNQFRRLTTGIHLLKLAGNHTIPICVPSPSFLVMRNDFKQVPVMGVVTRIVDYALKNCYDKRSGWLLIKVK